MGRPCLRLAESGTVPTARHPGASPRTRHRPAAAHRTTIIPSVRRPSVVRPVPVASKRVRPQPEEVRDEAHLSTEHPSPVSQARLPSPYAYARRSGDREEPSP